MIALISISLSSSPAGQDHKDVAAQNLQSCLGARAATLCKALAKACKAEGLGLGLEEKMFAFM